MVHHQIKSIFQSVFQADDLEIHPETAMQDVDGWNSLGHVKLIMEIERVFSTHLPLKETLKLTSAGKIQEYLLERQLLK